MYLQCSLPLTRRSERFGTLKLAHLATSAGGGGLCRRQLAVCCAKRQWLWQHLCELHLVLDAQRNDGAPLLLSDIAGLAAAAADAIIGIKPGA